MREQLTKKGDDMDDRSGVAVVGSINADLAAFGSPLPRPGETVIGTDFSLVLGGKGANQAIAAARAGAPTYMIGAVGDDLFRDLTLGALDDEGVDVTAVRIIDGSTGIAHIRVDALSAQNDIMIIPNANHRLSPDDVEASLRALRDVSVVLVQLEIPLAVVQRVAEVCQECELRLVLDPAPAQSMPLEVWRGVSVVKPNELEAEVLTGISVTDLSSAEQAARWFLDRGVTIAMITRGRTARSSSGRTASRSIRLSQRLRWTLPRPVMPSPAHSVQAWLAAPRFQTRCGAA